MSRWIINSIIVIAVVLMSFSSVWAAGPANVYEVRNDKFELYNGTTWITLFEGTSTAINIAAVDSGALAGQFLSGLSVPDGTYTRSRVTPSQTFTIKGNDGAGRYTTATAGANGGCVYTATAASEASCEITISTAITPETKTFATPITVKNGVPSHKVRVSFDTSQAIQYNVLADELFPSPPNVTVTLIAIE